MTDRQDIDALMVGAVYGELDDADRARLDAHLSSHPEDRAALDALERTRAQVRRGLAEMPAAEPSPSIAATLLQAAAKRAPAKADPADEGVWSRVLAWLRPVALNPAFAGAAILLLVAGTFLVTRNKDVAEPTFEAERAAPMESESSNHAAAEPAAAQAPADDQLADTVATPPAAAGDFRVDLDEAVAAGDKGGADTGRRREAAKTPAPAKKPAATKKRASKDVGYLEVAPKRDAVDIKGMPAAEEYKQELGLAEDRATTRGATRAEGKATGGAAATAAPAAPAAPQAMEPKPVDPELEEWAKKEHKRLLRLVAANKCPEAGRVGADIKYRAPEYYAANVANDRGVRACKQYIEGQAKKKAEKEYKSRSQSNTVDAESTTGK